MKGWDDKQTFLCVSGRSQEEEGAGWQSPLTRNMEEEEGEGFVPTAKEFGKNGGKDGRDARKVLLERNTLFVFHRSLARLSRPMPFSGYWMHGTKEAEEEVLLSKKCILSWHPWEP